MFKKVLYSIVIALVVFVLFGMFLPRQVHVQRHTDIERPPATVFTIVSTYRTFLSWSPWSARDPEALYEFSGPVSGTGARMSWSGDPRLVGSGWQEITEARPYSLIRMRLQFAQQGAATSYFQIDDTGSGVRLTWGFDKDLLDGQGWWGGLLARYFGLFFDRWIGTDYEVGLANLKALAESMPAADFSDLEVEIVQVDPIDILVVGGITTGKLVDFDSDLAAAYREIMAFIAQNEVQMAGQPMAITRIRDGRGYEVEAAIPIVPKDVLPNGRVLIRRSPAGRALRVVHHGPYEGLAAEYEKLAAWVVAHGLSEGHVSWEQYISDPTETPAAELVTHIYFSLEDGR